MTAAEAESADLIVCCPECGSSRSIYHRQQDKPEWICWVCNETFDEPDTRPRKAPEGIGLNRSQEILLEADQEEYP